MQLQTTSAIYKSIEGLQSVEDYEVKEIKGQVIKGPMKWVIMILGPNHQAKDIQSLLKMDYKNINIIIILVTNNKLYLRNDPMYVTGYGQNAGFKGLKSGPYKAGFQTKYASRFFDQSLKHMASGGGTKEFGNSSFYGGGKTNNQGGEIDQTVK